MYVRINDLGAKVGEDGKLHSIGQTSILLEWMEENVVLYRMMLDCGLKSKIDAGYNVKLNTTNLERIRNVMDDKVPGYESGIQALAASHCHEDHVGGYPWFYEYCKKKGIPVNGIPNLYMTSSTWKQFVPFQEDLYDLFVEPAKGSGFEWNKGIINEIAIYRIDKKYYTEQDVSPKPLDFDIRLRFLPAGHIVGSSMIEIDTIKQGISLGKILFTGDTCFREGGFLVDPINVQVIKDAYKAVIMEGTYIWNRPDEYKKLRCPELREILKGKIVDTITKGGNVVLLVYGVDRTANILVAVREIIDENKTGLDFKGKVFLDTKIGGNITRGYKYDFESFIRFDFSNEEQSYFKKTLVNRYNNGLGPSMLQLADKTDMFTYIQNSEHRAEIVEKHRDGGCIVAATSATLQGGTAVIRGSYMHPEGWGSDKKNLFIIVGGAIPGVMAKRALNQYRETEKQSPGNGWCDIAYSYYEKIDEGYKWYTEKLRFSSRLDDLSEFSAHANVDELLSFKQNVNSEKFIVTHIGGHMGNATSPDRAQTYINDTFMSGLSRLRKKGANLPLRGDIVILDGRNKAIVELEPDRKTLVMNTETYNALRIKCIKDKGDFGHTIACNVIMRLITEDDQRLAEFGKTLKETI